MGGTFRGGKNRGEHRGRNFRGGTALAPLIHPILVCVNILLINHGTKYIRFFEVMIKINQYRYSIIYYNLIQQQYTTNTDCARSLLFYNIVNISMLRLLSKKINVFFLSISTHIGL